jgi:hypothetical protein
VSILVSVQNERSIPSSYDLKMWNRNGPEIYLGQISQILFFLKRGKDAADLAYCEYLLRA